MTKVLHVIYSLELGGGPVHISKLTDDIPGTHFIAGGSGNMAEEFKKKLSNGHVFILKGSFMSRIKQIKNIENDINPDIIHVHGRGAAILVRASGIKDKAKRIVYTIHGFHANRMPIYKKWIYKQIELSLYRKTRAFIHVSKVEQREFISFLGSHDTYRHFYIPNYIDMPTGDRTGNATLPGINILYVGRLSEEKGVDILINAICKVASQEPIKFYIIGDGPDRSSYEEILKQKCHDANVHFLGTVKNAVALMNNYQAVVIPSRKEGLPYVLLEAMAHKMLIITTPEQSIKEILPPNYTFIAESFKPEDLAQKINQFAEKFKNGQEEIIRSIEENYQIFAREFSKEKIVQTLTNLYDKISNQ